MHQSTLFSLIMAFLLMIRNKFLSHKSSYFFVLFDHTITLLSSRQAAIFLVVGIIFMIGSLSLIVLDWIHNPPGSNSGH